MGRSKHWLRVAEIAEASDPEPAPQPEAPRRSLASWTKAEDARLDSQPPRPSRPSRDLSSRWADEIEAVRAWWNEQASSRPSPLGRMLLNAKLATHVQSSVRSDGPPEDPYLAEVEEALATVKRADVDLFLAMYIELCPPTTRTRKRHEGDRDVELDALGDVIVAPVVFGSAQSVAFNARSGTGGLPGWSSLSSETVTAAQLVAERAGMMGGDEEERDAACREVMARVREARSKIRMHLMRAEIRDRHPRWCIAAKGGR